jgi:hypothetical protein
MLFAPWIMLVRKNKIIEHTIEFADDLLIGTSARLMDYQCRNANPEARTNTGTGPLQGNEVPSKASEDASKDPPKGYWASGQ